MAPKKFENERIILDRNAFFCYSIIVQKRTKGDCFMGKNLITRFNYFDTMARAQKGYARLLEPICKKWDLTRNELDVILFLANNPEFDRAVDIVNHRGLAKSHVSMSVASLEDRGLLERTADAFDRRTVHLKLTEKAREITDVGCRVQKQFMDYLHQGVTEEQLELMRLFADRVYENIQNIEDIV